MENGTFDAKKLNWRLVNDNKIFYYKNDEIGEEYNLVKVLITKGWSSSSARKLIKKVKEFTPLTN